MWPVVLVVALVLGLEMNSRTRTNPTKFFQHTRCAFMPSSAPGFSILWAMWPTPTAQ